MENNISLDRIDIEIIDLLQNNARLSNKQIAAAVELAPSSVHERLKRLWENGIFLGAYAEVEPRAMGIGLQALFMIELSKHKRSTVEQFMDSVLEIPEVRTAHLITGRYDLVVHVVVRDTQHLKDLALDHFTNRPAITRIETSIIFDTRASHTLPNLKPIKGLE